MFFIANSFFVILSGKMAEIAIKNLVFYKGFNKSKKNK